MDIRTGLPLLCLLALSSCALGRQSMNDPVDALAVQRLQPGVTTAQEAVEILGGPVEVVQLGRRSAYLYSASNTKSAGFILVVINMFHQDTREDRVWVFFDENDVLSHYGSTFGTHRTQYAMPWEDIHEASDNEARDWERPGVEPSSAMVEEWR